MSASTAKDSRALLDDLIAFDTTSAKSNLALIEYVETYLKGYGVDSRRVLDPGGKKANLYATIGPQDVPGIMLSGHTDVVPTAGQNWSSDPYQVEERDGKLYGRGACDMKGFIACALAQVPALAVAELKTPMHLAFSYDEEVGCLGVRHLIDAMADMPVRPAMAIIGEPTSMRPMIGHKGKQALRVTISGHSCHSAYPTEGVNAVEYAAEIIAEVRRIHRRFAEHGPFDSDYRVPHTTLHVGVIQGGTAINIVPNHCQFDMEIRHLPEDDPQAIVAELEAFVNETLMPQMQRGGNTGSVSFEPLSGYPGLFTAPDADVVSFVRGLLEGDSAPSKISFGTEGGLFSQRLGIPAVVCGPGSIEQAHKPDEYVSLVQLAHCDRMLDALRNAIA